MAAHGGAADSYYNNAGAQPPTSHPPQAYGNGTAYQGQPGYQGQPQYQAPPEPKYQQPPPNYGPDFQNGGEPITGGGKQTFAQAFKIDKPKWNDLWAGILVGPSMQFRLLVLSNTFLTSLS